MTTIFGGSGATIREVSCLQLRLPFDHGAPAPLFAGVPRTTLDSGLIRVEIENGLVGWGEAYAADLDALTAIVKNRVAPLARGRKADDPTLVATLERALHLMGRSGPVLHALSGLDVALWDLRGKMEGVPVYALLGGARRTGIRAYASLLQYYGDTEAVKRNVSRALEDGYSEVKLHEKTAAAVAAARDVMGPGMPLMVDVNCAWTRDEAIANLHRMAPSNLFWIEEPTWPPEDIDALPHVRSATGVRTAAGENASSLQELSTLVRCGAVDFVQPSVIKCGGLSGAWRIASECRSTRVALAPHSPYFGPGFVATLHLLAAHPDDVSVERIHCELGFVPYEDAIPALRGHFQLPDTPGLGADPDPGLLDSLFVTHPT